MSRVAIIDRIDFLTLRPLDFSIYDGDVEVIDPTGVRLHGLKNYKGAFRLLHAIVNIFYCPERSGLTFRMCFDKARQNIRIHWNAQVIPKAIFGGYKTTLHVDGISVYELSRDSGNITQHRVERLIINDAMVMPEQGIFAALRGVAIKSNVDTIPVFNSGGGEESHVLKFQSFHPFSRSYLFRATDNDSEDKDDDNHPSQESMSALSSSSSTYDSATGDNIDWEALERRNASRKKFGLDPLTPEEFLELQDQVAELDRQQQQRAAAAATAAEVAKDKSRKDSGLLKKLFGNVLEDTCESNFDCQRPEVCCDFGFKKMCCASGMRIVDGPRSRQGQLAEVPVIANPNPYPPTSPRGRDYNGYPY